MRAWAWCKIRPSIQASSERTWFKPLSACCVDCVSEYDFHREGDGNQDLKTYTRDCKQVASEIFSDPIFKRAMTFNFVPLMTRDGACSDRLGVAYPISCRAVMDGVEGLLVLNMHRRTLCQGHLTVKPIYCTYSSLPWVSNCEGYRKRKSLTSSRFTQNTAINARRGKMH